MKNFDDELRELLAQEEPDTAKASAAGEMLLDEYRKRHEKTLICLAVFNAFMVFAALFCLASMRRAGTNDLIRMGSVGTMAVVGIALMRLWYWIMNAKHDTLREIKLLRLQMISRQAALAASDGCAGIVADLEHRRPGFLAAIRWSNIIAAVAGWTVGVLAN